MGLTSWKTAGNDPGEAESLSNTAGKLLQRLWPRDCYLCGEPAGTTAVCGYCEDALPRLLAAHSCPSCALPTPQGTICGACLKRPPAFDASEAVFAYASPLREMILAVKHGRGFAQIDWLGDALADRLACSDWRPDLIVPMPLHAVRLCERGFNQSAELAKRVRAVCGIPLALDLLVRDIDTPRLEGLRKEARQRAVRGAFRCREALNGRRVVVIDDVMTSGASLNELARTLKASGAAQVCNLVVARTLRRVRQ